MDADVDETDEEEAMREEEDAMEEEEEEMEEMEEEEEEEEEEDDDDDDDDVPRRKRQRRRQPHTLFTEQEEARLVPALVLLDDQGSIIRTHLVHRPHARTKLGQKKQGRHRSGSQAFNRDYDACGLGFLEKAVQNVHGSPMNELWKRRHRKTLVPAQRRLEETFKLAGLRRGGVGMGQDGMVGVMKGWGEDGLRLMSSVSSVSSVSSE